MNTTLVSPEKAAFKEYILSICSALGGFEKPIELTSKTSSNPAYRGGLVYVPGDECLECIKDLRKLLRQEERTLDKPVRLLLSEWKTFSEDLLPILALNTDFFKNPLGRSCFELIAYLMTPIVSRPFSNNVAKEIREQEEMVDSVKDSTNYEDEDLEAMSVGSEDNNSAFEDDAYSSSEGEENTGTQISANVAIKEHRFYQLRYLRTLLHNKWFFFHLIEQVSILLNMSVWSEDDERFLFTTLTLIRSMLALEEPQETSIQSSHDLLLECLQECHALDLLLVLIASVKDFKFQPYIWLFQDIVYSIFRHVDFDNLCSSVQADGKIAESSLTTSKSGLQQYLKGDQACTLNELISKTTRHSKFGGTNTLHMTKGKEPNFFSPNNLSKKNVLSGPGLANLKVASPEALLKLLQLRRGDSHNKRVTVKIDIDVVRVVMHGPSRRLLLEFIYQYTCGAAVSLFEATQSKSLKSTTDDRGREIFVLTLTLKLAYHYLTTARDWTVVRAILSQLSSSTLPHYIMSCISDFKDNKCYKALGTALEGLRAWLVLILSLHKLPDDFSPISSNSDSPEEVTTILQQIQQVGHHHLHNFVHDYALLRPLHDLYHSPYYHPTVLPALIPCTYYLNQAVKQAIMFRKGDLFARAKKLKRSKRPKKPKSNKKQKKVVIIDPEEEKIESATSFIEKPKDSSELPKADTSPPRNQENVSELTETSDALKKKTLPINDPLAALFSDDEEEESTNFDSQAKLPPKEKQDEQQPEKPDDDSEGFVVSDDETELKSDEESDTEDDSTREYNERSLDFKKFLQTYNSDSIIRGHIIFMERVLAQAGSPGMLLHQSDLHTQLNDRLQMVTTMLHQLVVQLDSMRLMYQASYLHTLHSAALQCKAISAAFLVPSTGGKLVAKLPPSLRWVNELDRFVEYVFLNILGTLRKDPWLLESLLPKSASKDLKRAAMKPVTPPPTEATNPVATNYTQYVPTKAPVNKTTSDLPSQPSHSASLDLAASNASSIASPMSNLNLNSISDPRPPTTTPAKAPIDEFDFSDEFFEDLFV